MSEAKTVGELKKSGVSVLPVREEMRKNLVRHLENGQRILPGIIGYDETVIPEIENAILAGHHMVFLGERGQGKSRVIRGLLSLLDERIPIVHGCEINDNPFSPICRACRNKAAELGDALPLQWIDRDHRYGEKLATPDVSIADLVGEIDPIKVAEGRYLADEETIHYGLVPRTNRGIFAINELPDLTEKVQVGLFNLMEEKDVQINVVDNVLTIRGEKNAEKEEKGKNHRLIERSYGSFERRLELPDGVNVDAIKANIAKGVLKVSVPKPAPAQVKKIDVKVAA